MHKLTSKTAGAFLFALAATTSCASNVPVATSPCPCASGNFCCASGVCAAGEDACGAATAALSLQASGDWVGYLENFNFQSGSDTIKLLLTVQPDGSLGGRVIVGVGTPPAAPVDPNVGWPRPSGPDGGAVDVPMGFPQFNLFEGYEYTARQVRWEALRLRLGFLSTQPWRPWCELQTPVAVAGDGYACADTHSWSYTPQTGCILDTNPPQQINCSKAELCAFGNPCFCTATNCTLQADPTSAGDNTLDVSLQADRGDGSIRINGGGAQNVRLTRQH